MSETLELTLLGGMDIRHNGIQVTGFVSNKAQALLCYLAVTGRAHSRDELAGLLWEDMADTEAKANLRSVLFNLRQLLAPYLRIDRQSVAFEQQATSWLDVAHFRSGSQQHGSGAFEHDIRSLRETVGLYRGDLLQGFYVRNAPAFEEWLLAEREHVRQLAVQALYRVAAHYTAAGEHAEAIHYTIRLLEMDPWREEVHRQLMLLQALNGQRNAALGQYETCRRILANDLQIEPDEETTALYERIRNGTWDTVPHAGPPVRRAAVDAHTLPGHTPLPFVGRGAEYTWLFQQWNAARCHSGVLTIVQGEAGVGKTRLAEELLRYAVGSGALLLRGLCQAFERDVPYLPFVEVLRAVLQRQVSLIRKLPSYCLIELARLLPELHGLDLDLPAVPMMSDDASRQRLFEAIAQLFMVLVNERPSVVLFLDDLHHADPATVDLLRYLLYRLQGAPFWCIGTHRLEEEQDNSVVRLFHDLEKTQRIAVLRLQPLDVQSVGRLAGQLLDPESRQAQQLAAYLSNQAEGNAFILSQLLHDLEQRGILQTTNGVRRLDSQRLAHEPAPVPPSVQAMILGRISRLPPSVRAILDVAAVVGKTFDLHLLTMASGQDSQEVSESLEILLTRQLVRESRHAATTHRDVEGANESDGHLPRGPRLLHSVEYEFTHDMVRQVIDAGLSPGYRQRLLDRFTATNGQLHRAPSLIVPGKKR